MKYEEKLDEGVNGVQPSKQTVLQSSSGEEVTSKKAFSLELNGKEQRELFNDDEEKNVYESNEKDLVELLQAEEVNTNLDLLDDDDSEVLTDQTKIKNQFKEEETTSSSNELSDVYNELEHSDAEKTSLSSELSNGSSDSVSLKSFDQDYSLELAPVDHEEKKISSSELVVEESSIDVKEKRELAVKKKASKKVAKKATKKVAKKVAKKNKKEE